MTFFPSDYRPFLQENIIYVSNYYIPYLHEWQIKYLHLYISI